MGFPTVEKKKEKRRHRRGNRGPAEHGKFLADFFTDKNDVVCKVNVGKGMGHSNHVLKMVSGEFIKQIFEL